MTVFLCHPVAMSKQLHVIIIFATKCCRNTNTSLCDLS